MSCASRLFSYLLLLMFGVALAAPGVGSQDQPQQTQDQSQKDQQQQKKKKKGGGFFGGLKAITGESSEQTEATATAGSKSVGEGDGARIADTTPTAADRRKVSEMENYSVPEKDLKKFQEDGHLVPKK